MRFSIITASYNPGDKIEKTIHSVLEQTFRDYEIIIKDACSTDGSVENLIRKPEVAKEIASGKIRLFVQPDQGVYDGMNQAITQAGGDFLLFLNCGDTLHDAEVLQKVEKFLQTEVISAAGEKEQSREERIKEIVYGDTFCEQTGQTDFAAPLINGFTCYRNIPCHQSCFYAKRLFEEKQYDTSLRIRADYDHFLWCVFDRYVKPKYMNFIVSDYEGGGISETKDNREQDKQEHEEVIRRYMTPQEIGRYRRRMALTLAPVRKKIAESKTLSGVYQKVKQTIYHA